MEFGGNKLKIVWICHFAFHELTQKLKEIGAINKNRTVNEFATWINALIRIFEQNKQIEVHIIAPYQWIKKDITLKYNNINYHLFNAGIPAYGRYWPRKILPIDYLTNFFLTKHKVRKIVRKVNPDLIHLHGAENAYYSETIMQFKDKYPIFITVQGFLFLTNNSFRYVDKRRIIIELKIYSIFKHFNIRADFMKEILYKYNSEAVFYKFMYPIPIKQTITLQNNNTKDYDFAFYSRVVKTKGIEDVLKALGIIKKKIPNVTLAIIGNWPNPKYKNKLDILCHKYDIKDNISFLGYFPTLEKAHKILSTARILVSPTYNDIIPGTIIESMFMKIPVIAYKSGGVPDINQTGDYVKLVEPGDINALANQMEKLFSDDKLCIELAEKSFVRINEMFDNSKVFPNFINCYKTVIEEFNN